VARVFGPLPMNLLPAVDGVITGVRPERVRVHPDGPATVVAVEPAGEDCLVRVDDLLARLPWPDAPQVGERVTVEWRREDEHHFDAATGARR
jgi:ABC-type sugar transport system ATPase subunit